MSRLFSGSVWCPRSGTTSLGQGEGRTEPKAMRGPNLSLAIDNVRARWSAVSPRTRLTIRDRLEAIGGTLHVHSAPGEGTCVRGSAGAMLTAGSAIG